MEIRANSIFRNTYQKISLLAHVIIAEILPFQDVQRTDRCCCSSNREVVYLKKKTLRVKADK